MNEFVKVPFHTEEDGSKTFFLPNCKYTKRNQYQIGQRHGDQQYVADYWKALEILLAMPTPRFRRKNPKGSGRPGTVSCEPGNVEDVSRAFIEAERVKVGG